MHEVSKVSSIERVRDAIIEIRPAAVSDCAERVDGNDAPALVLDA